MRNLKKILSLVLAMMMVLSLMVTASATQYEDADDIQYTEAVEVMSGLGVLSGVKNADGTYDFQPGNGLKRDAAAKIVAYIANGGEVTAADVDGMTNPFKDVSGWAEKVIVYCYNKGIINGVNAANDVFSPSTPLNGYAFAKMLLVAAGIEGEYTGSNWKLNIATAAKDAGLLAGLPSGFLLSKDITREEACQMAFNAMNWSEIPDVYEVRYTEDSQDHYTVVGEFDNLLDASLYAQVLGGYAAGTGYYAEKAASTDTLMAKNFKADVAAYSENGMDGYYWHNAKGYPISSVIYTDTVLGTSNDGTSLVALTSPKGTNTYNSAKYIAALDTGAAVYYNGHLVEQPANGAEVAVGDYVFNGNAIMVVTAAGHYLVDGSWDQVCADYRTPGIGVEITLVNTDSDAKAEKVLLVQSYYDMIVGVTNVPESKTEGAYTNYTLTTLTGKVYTSYVTGYETDDIAIYDGAALYDNVIVTAQADTIDIARANLIVGTMTQFNTTTNTYTINGTAYRANVLADYQTYVLCGAALTGLVGVPAYYVLDNNGYVIAATPVTATANYAIVTELALVSTQPDGSIGSTASKYLEAEVVGFDGLKEIVKVASVVNGGTTYTATGANSTTEVTGANKGDVKALVEGQVVSYTVNAKGEYVLKVTTQTVDASSATLAKTANFVVGNTTIVANNSTKFVVRTGNAVVGYTYTVYTGYANVPAKVFADNSATVKGIKNAAGTAAAYVYITGTDASTAASSDWAYVYGSATYNYVSAAVAYYEYNAIVNGVPGTIKVATTASVGGDVTAMSGLYNLTATANATGYVTAAAPVVGDTVAVKAADGVIKLTDGGYKTYNGSETVYVIDAATNTVSSPAITTIGTNYQNVVVTYVKDAAGNNTDVISMIIAVKPAA